MKEEKGKEMRDRQTRHPSNMVSEKRARTQDDNSHDGERGLAPRLLSSPLSLYEYLLNSYSKWFIAHTRCSSLVPPHSLPLIFEILSLSVLV